MNTEAAGIQLSNRGAILVDEHLRTNVPGIWAMGDVTGGLQFTYISLDDYRVIKDELFGKGTRTKDEPPGCGLFRIYRSAVVAHRYGRGGSP